MPKDNVTNIVETEAINVDQVKEKFIKKLVKKFKCTYCEREFSFTNNLEAHIKRQHEDKFQNISENFEKLEQSNSNNSSNDSVFSQTSKLLLSKQTNRDSEKEAKQMINDKTSFLVDENEKELKSQGSSKNNLNKLEIKDVKNEKNSTMVDESKKEKKVPSLPNRRRTELHR